MGTITGTQASSTTLRVFSPRLAQSLHAIVCKDWKELGEFRACWQSILHENPTLTVFMTPEWLESWWSAFGKEKELSILVLRDADGITQGILPFYRERVRTGFGRKLWRLRLVGDGSGDSDNLDLIVRPGSEQVVASAFVNWLRGESPCDIVELNTMCSTSVAMRALLQALEATRWSSTTYSEPWSAVALPASWSDYLGQISSKERSKIGNRLRRLQNRYQTMFTKCVSQSELACGLQTLFNLHQKRWQARGKPGDFSGAERRCFYQQMARKFLDRGWLELWVMTLDGKPVAAQFAFRYRDTVFSLQEGFDPDHAADSVGYVLRSYLLKHFIDMGARRYEFLGGYDESKERWGTESGVYLNIHFALPQFWGNFHIWKSEKKRNAKRWITGRLPLPARQALQRLFGSFRDIRKAFIGAGASKEAESDSSQ